MFYALSIYMRLAYVKPAALWLAAIGITKT